MNIEKFYYDEQTEMYEQMKKEQDEHEQSLSVEEREKEHQKLFQEARTIMEKAERKKKEEYQIINPVKYQRFIYLSERAIQFSKISGCNIKIQTFPDMSALIKMQTGYMWNSHFISIYFFNFSASSNQNSNSTTSFSPCFLLPIPTQSASFNRFFIVSLSSSADSPSLSNQIYRYCDKM